MSSGITIGNIFHNLETIEPEIVPIGELPLYTVVKFFGGKGKHGGRIGFIERLASESRRKNPTVSVCLSEGMGIAGGNVVQRSPDSLYPVRIRMHKLLYHTTPVEIMERPSGDNEEEQRAYAIERLRAQGDLRVKGMSLTKNPPQGK
jgi:hypothetical protein